MSDNTNTLISEQRVEELETIFWEKYAKHNEDESGLEGFLEEREDYINLLSNDPKLK